VTLTDIMLLKGVCNELQQSGIKDAAADRCQASDVRAATSQAYESTVIFARPATVD